MREVKLYNQQDTEKAKKILEEIGYNNEEFTDYDDTGLSSFL